MKTKFRYETPMLVDLSAESALGATCLSGTDVTYHCDPGSCPGLSQCFAGTAAQKCNTGTNAGNYPSNPNCWGCCQTGTGIVSPGYPCFCSPGYGSTWQCSGYGGNAGVDCGTGANYPYCY
jgi:hypothetical protein